MPVQSPGSYHLFRLFGVDVFVHWSWFIAAYLLYLWSGVAFSAFALTYASLFAIVLIHEFGHALACHSVGGQANRIVLWPLGGIAFVRPPNRPGAVLWSIAAGPLVNVALVPLTLALLVLFGPYGVQGISGMQVFQFMVTHPLGPVLGSTQALSPLQSYLILLADINLVLLFFNLLPIYPLDGGQILQAILWFFVGQAKSLRITAVIGIVGAAAGAVFAILAREWVLLAIAIFVGWQATIGIRYARMLDAAHAANPWDSRK